MPMESKASQGMPERPNEAHAQGQRSSLSGEHSAFVASLSEKEKKLSPVGFSALAEAPVPQSGSSFTALRQAASLPDKSGSFTAEAETLRQTEEGVSMEQEEEEIQKAMTELPIWYTTLTPRALITSIILGAAFSIISLKLGLTTGIIPSLNIAAGLLGFFFIFSLEKFLNLFNLSKRPFTAQENTVIQTCVVACYGMAFNGGFATYLLAMDQQSYENVGDIPGNNPSDVYQPTLGRTLPYMFCISLLGVFFLLPLRKKLIVDYQLTFPSGTATGLMIQSFHTRDGTVAAMKQIKAMGIWFAFSFIFSGWKWVFSGTSGPCADLEAYGGFASFPTLGLQALANTWTFDFSQNYVGVGMLCPLIVDYSILFGCIISWGLMWPLISNQAGNWYPAGLPANSMEGLYAYKVWVAIFVFIGDGLYILVKLTTLTLVAWRTRHRAAVAAAKAEAAGVGVAAIKDSKPGLDDEGSQRLAVGGLAGETPYMRRLRKAVFMRGAIPWWIGVAGYVAMLAIATGCIPQIYPPAKWYMCLVAGLVAPFLAFANAFGCGMSDWNMASTYGKLAIFIFAAWAGSGNQGVIAGLAVCGIAFASISAAADMMQDFKTGYITLSSPRAMFVAQLAGAIMGCIIAPLVFLLFWSAFDLGVPGSTYAAPYGTVYRAMAVIGTSGFSALPDHCLQLCIGFFFLAIVMNLGRDFLPEKIGRWIPLPMVMAIPFYIGAWLGIDMGVGALIVLFWRWANKPSCDLLSAAVASGLIAGDGIWTIPSAVLAMVGVNPPICMGWSTSS